MSDGSPTWHKYVYEGKGYWWCCEANGDWFLESSPGQWTRYLDPISNCQYWWRDDATWFWINDCHGESGHALAADTAFSNNYLENQALKSTAQPQQMTSLEVSELCFSTPRTTLEMPATRQSELHGGQEHWTCRMCEEPNNAKRSECYCCGARQVPPGIAPENSLPLAKELPPPSPPSRAANDTKHPGLPLLGDCALVGMAWTYPLRDEMQRSYVGLLPGGLSSKEAQTCFRAVIDGMDDLGWSKPPLGARSGSSGGGGARRSGVMTRGTKWMVRKGCCCSYRHATVNTVPLKAMPFPSWMEKIMHACMPACGLADPAMWPNSCLLNCYSDGSEAIDWHCDNERLFGGLSNHGEKIISLALGSERVYEMRPSDVAYYEDSALSCSLVLNSGDIWSMEGQTPKHYMHRVPKYSGGKKGGPVRGHVSLTWRWIVSHESNRCCT